MQKFDNNEEWIKKLSEYIIFKFWSIEKYKNLNENYISSIFLAWAPWAWKTEFLNTIFSDLKKNFIFIDIDLYRWLFKGYDWENSWEYQECSVKVSDKILKFCFKNNLNFVFDWTFRNYNKVKQNFKQCQKYNRQSLIVLLFQEPRISFYYTYLRKIEKKRNVPIDVFVDWFYGSIENIFRIKKDFKKVDLVITDKKYSPLNKDKFTYFTDYKVNTIEKFTKKYNVSYNNWVFNNKKFLKIDLEKFKNILDEKYCFCSNNSFVKLYRWIKIWLLEKIYKI